MNKSMYRLLDIKMIVFLTVMLFASPILCGKNSYPACLIYSHYLTIYMNNIFFLMIYKYSSNLNAIAPYFITRVKEDRFYVHSYNAIFCICLIYNLIIYISYYFFFGSIPHDAYTLTFFFMIMNIIIMEIECSIIYIQIGQKKNFIYLTIPLLMNVIFHMLFIKIF